jgi:hypothetical protein
VLTLVFVSFEDLGAPKVAVTLNEESRMYVLTLVFVSFDDLQLPNGLDAIVMVDKVYHA